MSRQQRRLHLVHRRACALAQLEPLSEAGWQNTARHHTSLMRARLLDQRLLAPRQPAAEASRCRLLDNILCSSTQVHAVSRSLRECSQAQQPRLRRRGRQIASLSSTYKNVRAAAGGQERATGPRPAAAEELTRRPLARAVRSVFFYNDVSTVTCGKKSPSPAPSAAVPGVSWTSFASRG